MSKDRDPKKSKHKRHDKRDASAKLDKKRSRAAEDEIAAAEKQLAKALRILDNAREQLMVREHDLRHVLQKHGRMPKHTTGGERDSQVDQDDAATGDALADEPSDGALSSGESNRVEVSSDHSPPDASSDGVSKSDNSTIPIFDQRQVVTSNSAGSSGEGRG